MKEFDELLYEVLLEDAGIEVPAGMESRIALTLTKERKRQIGKRKRWIEALAAAILLGLAGTWALRSSRQVVSVDHKASVPESRAVVDNSASLPWASRGSRGAAAGRASIPASRLRRQLQRNIPRLAPLEIEPLVIEPIEIASSTSSTLTRKGEVR